MLNFLAIDVGNWVEIGLRTLFYGLCTMVYRLVIGMYNIFELLCTVRILDMDVVDTLAQRIGLILGLVMLFIVIFSLINSLINPELLSDKAKSPVNVIKKVLLVIVMFGVSTFAFNGLYYVQKVVIKSNVIVKLFVPAEVSTDNFGNLLTSEMFMNFYTINKDLEGVSNSEIDNCESVIDNLEAGIINDGVFDVGKKCLSRTIDVNGENVFIVDFSYFYSLIVGGFLVYFLFMYCLNVGVRTFQLVFLEIISPMAFVGYLSPKNDNMFTKWIKMYFSTYIDIFIRIGIISFVTFIISAILGNGTDYGNLVEVIAGTSGLTKILLEILLIFALLTFAKKAPDLLKELFPSGASKLGFGVNTPKQMFSNMLGGNFVESGFKRAYGMAAVGANAWQQNVRKALGNNLSNRAKLKAEMAKPENERDQAKIAQLRADVRKTNGRLAGSLAFGGFGGMRRGLMTTNKSQRASAASNAYAATQSKYKMRDLGYGAGVGDLFLQKDAEGKVTGLTFNKDAGNALKERVKDVGRGFVMQDLHIEDVADMKDLSIESMQRALQRKQENLTDAQMKITISKSKAHDGMYIYDDGSGAPQLLTEDQINAKGNDAKVVLDIAKLKGNIGKASGDAKKLHQKAEEQKSKNDKK